MFIITPKIKDIILEDLLSAEPNINFNYRDSETKYGFKPQYVKMILEQFEEIGLTKNTRYFTGYGAMVHLQAKAMDLYRHGGFAAEEELLKANIEKLGRELDLLAKQLGPNYIEKAANIAQIGSAIMQALVL